MFLRSIGDVLYVRRWIVVGVIALALLAAPLFLSMLRPTFQATAEVVMIGNGSTGTNSDVVPIGDVPDLAYSSDVIQRVHDGLHLTMSTDKLRSMISVKASSRSNVVPVSARSKSPGQTLLIANRTADELVAEYRSLASRQYDRDATQLRSLVENEQARIRTIDRQLQLAVAKDSYAGGEHALDTLTARLAQLDSDRAAANAQYVSDQASATAQADQGKLGDVVREQALLSDPKVQALRAGAAKDASEYAFEKAGYTDAYPGLAGLHEKVAREDAAVSSASDRAASQHAGASATYAQILLNQHNSEALASGDRARISAIDRQIAQTRGHIADLPTAGVQTNALRLERDSAEAAYTQLAIRQQQALADQSHASALSSLVVLDHAEAASPRIPSTIMAMLLAVLILSVALGAAYAAEFLNPRIRTTAEIEGLYGIKHFGSITRS